LANESWRLWGLGKKGDMPNMATTFIIVRESAHWLDKKVDNILTKCSLKEEKLEHWRSSGVPWKKHEGIHSNDTI
jgi:hypothetical protein